MKANEEVISIEDVRGFVIDLATCEHDNNVILGMVRTTRNISICWVHQIFIDLIPNFGWKIQKTLFRSGLLVGRGKNTVVISIIEVP